MHPKGLCIKGVNKTRKGSFLLLYPCWERVEWEKRHSQEKWHDCRAVQTILCTATKITQTSKIWLQAGSNQNYSEWRCTHFIPLLVLLKLFFKALPLLSLISETMKQLADSELLRFQILHFIHRFVPALSKPTVSYKLTTVP